jgi:flagellin-like hook-associated protein FlgL
VSELASLAQDVTKSDADRSLYDAEFQQIYDYFTSAASKDFNGVSLFSNYRSQFNSIIRTSSFADLLAKLRSKEIEAHVIPRPGRRS